MTLETNRLRPARTGEQWRGGVQVPLRHHESPYLAGAFGASGTVLEGNRPSTSSNHLASLGGERDQTDKKAAEERGVGQFVH